MDLLGSVWAGHINLLCDSLSGGTAGTLFVVRVDSIGPDGGRSTFSRTEGHVDLLVRDTSVDFDIVGVVNLDGAAAIFSLASLATSISGHLNKLGWARFVESWAGCDGALSVDGTGQWVYLAITSVTGVFCW